MSILAIAIFGVFLFLGFLCLEFSVFFVREKTVAIVERMGKYHRMAQAGINFKIPFFDWVVKRVDMRMQEMNVEVETKTKDNVFVQVKIAVQYLVKSDKVYESNYALEDPYAQITSYVYDVIRAEVPKQKLDDVFESKDTLANNLKTELDKTMEGFGFDIVKALVTDIDPASNVKEAMNRINAAERLKVAAEAEGEAYKVTIVKKAEAEAESKKLQGQGVADQRKAIVQGFKESVKDMAEATNVSSEEVMNMVLMTQYFDTMQEVGKEGKVIFMPNNPGAVGDIRKEMMAAIMAGNVSLPEKGKKKTVPQDSEGQPRS